MANFTCGLACMTALSLSEVENWLDSNCPDDWTVRLADGQGPLAGGKMKIEVLFETREDMATFKAGFKSFEAQAVSSGGGVSREDDGLSAGEKRADGMLRPGGGNGF